MNSLVTSFIVGLFLFFPARKEKKGQEFIGISKYTSLITWQIEEMWDVSLALQINCSIYSLRRILKPACSK